MNATAGLPVKGRAIESVLARPLPTFARAAVTATTGEAAIIYWNADAERLYGWRAFEVMSRSVLDVIPDGSHRGEVAKATALTQAGLPWMGRLTAQRRRGPPFRVFGMVFPVGDVAHGAGALVGVSVPDAQRRLIEPDGPRVMAELHFRVARLGDRGRELIRRPIAPPKPASLSIGRLTALHLRQPFAKEPTWRLMQRIETYRHRADRLSAGGGTKYFAERQLAQMWLRLADRLAARRR